MALIDERLSETLAAATQADARAIIQCLRQELQAREDRRIALGMMSNAQSAATSADARAIVESLRQEQQAREDRRIALGMMGNAQSSTSSNTDDFLDAEVSEDLLQNLEAIYPSPDTDRHEAEDVEVEVVQAGPSTRTSAPLHKNENDAGDAGESPGWDFSRLRDTPARSSRKPTETCNSCLENRPAFGTAICPCDHKYCRECLFNLISACLVDESLFPPRCCKQAIPLSELQKHLPQELMDNFTERSVEFETKDRTYCPESSCLAFIPPANIRGDIATCPRCASRVCVHCKARYHEGNCPQDPALQALLALANAENWQQCYSCSRVIELDTGCYHMTCKCNAQFCYLCGAPWKTCRCPQWEERRLVARGEDIVNRRADANRIAPEALLRLVQAEVENQRRNHECEHDSWANQRGAATCEECGNRLPYFIYECRGCRIRACRRCRFNRF